MDGQCPLNDKFAEHSAHEASSAWQLPPLPGPAASSLTLRRWQRAWPSAFAAFHIGWVWGCFVFVTGNVTAGLNLIEVFCMHTPRPPG